jgi:hypothetical protein
MNTAIMAHGPNVHSPNPSRGKDYSDVEGAISDFGRSSRFTPLTCSYTVELRWS